jgi:hypothetical protein
VCGTTPAAVQQPAAQLGAEPSAGRCTGRCSVVVLTRRVAARCNDVSAFLNEAQVLDRRGVTAA